MGRPLTNILCFFILLAGVGSARAQDGVIVKASINTNQILIGEPVRLSLDVKSPMVSGNQMPFFDSIPHFEMIEKASLDSIISASGATYHMEWKLTSFDSGTRFIPSLAVTIGTQVYKTDSLAVEVSYGNVDTSKDYHDIRGIIDIENPNVKYIPWAIGAITLIALALFVWLIRKKPTVIRQPSTVNQQPGLSPFEEAMVSLDNLKKMPKQDPASVKKYYSALNDTLRVYLYRTMGLATMEKTSEDLILIMSGLNMEKEAFSKLTASLRMGDFVKFAKYIPGPFEIDNNLEELRNAIKIIDESRFSIKEKK
jgi:hypothetical protein